MPPALSSYFCPNFFSAWDVPHPPPPVSIERPPTSNFPGGMAPQSPSYPSSMLVSILEFIHVQTSEYTKQTVDILQKIIQK